MYTWRITVSKELTIKPQNNRDNRRDMGPRINNKIIAKSVQVIDNNGQNMGVMPTSAALQMAMDAGFDLVELNASSVPPVVKIMDFGKYKYEQKKRASEAKKKQKITEMKEVWIKPFIEENDLQIKLRKVLEFLDDGDKVKISVMTRGNRRVLAIGRDSVPALFEHVVELIGDRGTLESRSKPDERTKSIVIAPAKPVK
ncbi:MAG: translation initiation factor IF-3 [Alphaproteobacteria bacterium]|nr:translation initiation factor IF-3 [Alphaproteobacteria bacterium]